MVISVITWDAGFRESFHTVDSFRSQTIGADQYEFIWVDYYSTINEQLRKKFEDFPNARCISFGGTGEWHLGRALNHAVQLSQGDLLVIPDGDVVVRPDFLERVLKAHADITNAAIYFRRWDQPKPHSVPPERDAQIEELSTQCKLENPTNYGGCISIRRTTFEGVGGYEEHELFAGAGAISMELYTRLKNYGAAILWHPDVKLYHPWHAGTLPNSETYRAKLSLQRAYISQSDLLMHSLGNSGFVEQFLKSRVTRRAEEKAKKGLFPKLRQFFGADS